MMMLEPRPKSDSVQAAVGRRSSVGEVKFIIVGPSDGPSDHMASLKPMVLQKPNGRVVEASSSEALAATVERAVRAGHQYQLRRADGHRSVPEVGRPQLSYRREDRQGLAGEGPLGSRHDDRQGDGRSFVEDRRGVQQSAQEHLRHLFAPMDQSEQHALAHLNKGAARVIAGDPRFAAGLRRVDWIQERG